MALPTKPIVVHMGFEDPPRLAENSKNETEALKHYRRIRDDIKVFVNKLPEILTQKKRKMWYSIKPGLCRTQFCFKTNARTSKKHKKIITGKLAIT
jgi:hypothetical protein